MKFSKEAKISLNRIEKTEPCYMKGYGNFMQPVVYKKPVGVKFAMDDKVDILDKQYNIREQAEKPGPGRYELHTEFH